MITSREITYYVPTRGRTSRRPIALEELRTAGLLGNTVLVCPMMELAHWDDWARQNNEPLTVVEEPESVRNIGDCRAFMLEHCRTRYFFMIDDDVSFSHRYENGTTTPSNMNPLRLRKHLHDEVLDMFQVYPVVGIGSRMFCQDRPFLVEDKQTGWAWGYDVWKVKRDLRECFGRLVIHEDTDWCLTLLGKGHHNVILSYIVASARSVANSPEEGGCGIYRTPELVREQTAKFVALHPGVVTMREPRPGLPETTQYRHRVAWRKAFGALLRKE